MMARRYVAMNAVLSVAPSNVATVQRDIGKKTKHRGL
jgi:hypothetical protein